ncbi:hypothetical protein JI59_08585 [Novosphingobium pentaromativorans US6-1]|uniref:Uncharacterized protein n=2 Tax=Novosphingobium pentaromativorans TaxID=205844 RepID=G6ED82_9SPHN|nr:hypothetical protein JI59_08585 [Novosphingobium pentaromativorans US6-1]EHJ60744.1 hypothetical protein NSU_2302 [Novosphingobium pentaromativorans US6-1]
MQSEKDLQTRGNSFLAANGWIGNSKTAGMTLPLGNRIKCRLKRWRDEFKLELGKGISRGRRKTVPIASLKAKGER